MIWAAFLRACLRTAEYGINELGLAIAVTIKGGICPQRIGPGQCGGPTYQALSKIVLKVLGIVGRGGMSDATGSGTKRPFLLEC